jgi:hypothetical protein
MCGTGSNSVLISVHNMELTCVFKFSSTYGHIKRMPEKTIPKLIMEWTPLERRKRGRPRKTWIGVQAAMTKRNLEPDQWRNREEWHFILVSGRQQQLIKLDR